ncbi:hypothetical protein JCM12296A_57920 [Desulfosarcina cetonica]
MTRVLKKIKNPQERRSPKTRIAIIEACFNGSLIDKKGRIDQDVLIERIWGTNISSEDKERKRKKGLSALIMKVNKEIHKKGKDDIDDENIPFYIRKENEYVIPCFDIQIINKQLDKRAKRRTGDKIKRDWLEGLYFGQVDVNCEITVSHIGSGKADDWLEEPVKYRRDKLFRDWLSNPEWKYYPGPSYGVYGTKARHIHGRLSLEFQLFPTDYFYFLATQEEYEARKNKISREIDVNRPIPQFAHSISPAALLVVRDGSERYAIFAKRKGSLCLGTGEELMGLPICVTPRRAPSLEEMTYLSTVFKKEGLGEDDIKDILRPDSVEDDLYSINFFINPLIRGAKMELGIDELSKESIDFIAYGLDSQRYLYSLIAFVEIEMPLSELELSHINSLSASTQHELIHVRFNPDAIAEFIKGLKKSEYCPTTQMAAYYACVHCFDAAEVARSFSGMLI